MTNLSELASRVEALQGKDREVELAIWAAIDPVNAALAESEGKRPLPWLYCYTASLDAAMTLVPKDWLVFLLMDLGDKWACKLRRVGDAKAQPAYEGSSAALTITAAALRARDENGENSVAG